jgi:hypothetical protein
VVNDPVTWFAPLDSLLRVEEIPIDAVKLSDVNCEATSDDWMPHCDVSLAPQGQGTYVFRQSCGLELCGVRGRHTKLVSWHPAPGIDAELQPGAPLLPEFRMQPRWSAIRFTIADPQARLLYFDPVKHAFEFAQGGD